MAEFVIKLADERGRVMSKRKPPPQPMSCVRGLSMLATTSLVKARSGFAGMKRRKVKLDRFSFSTAISHTHPRRAPDSGFAANAGEGAKKRTLCSPAG